MNKELVTKVGSLEQDNLIARLTPTAETTGIVIKKLGTAATLKRGTLLCADASGKYGIYGGAGNVKKQEFNGDGVEDDFTLTEKGGKIIGVKVGTSDATVIAYNEFTGVVTLSAAPAAGTKNVVVTYEIGEASVPSMILADDVDVGTAEDAVAVGYRSGNFNPAAIIVAEGYTLTDADLDALRKYDIIFTQML